MRVKAPGVDGLLSEDSQQEVSLLPRLKGGRHDAVGTGRQPVTAGHFTHVDELWRLGARCIVLEEVDVQRATVWVVQLHSNAQHQLDRILEQASADANKNTQRCINA